MKKYKGSAWRNVDSYLTVAEVIVPERNRTMKFLVDIFGYRFETKECLSLLDIGCGDGIVSARIRERYPKNSFFLLDGSLEMLEKAKKRLKGENITFIHQSFEEYTALTAEKEKYDFIYSAHAIHHLDLVGKSKLYRKIFNELRPGGLFLNLDPVLPTSEKSETWQFKMWRDWINETLHKKGSKSDIGKYDNVPYHYKSNEENKPSSLFEQLELLEEIGFQNVDCFYKFSVIAIFGGTKQESC